MAWLFLVLAGLLEIAWAIGLKESNGFTRLWWSVFTLAALAASMVLLALAVKTLPIGTAYPVWVGIGALGTALLGMWFYEEPATLARGFFILLLVVGIVGLKVTSAQPNLL